MSLRDEMGALLGERAGNPPPPEMPTRRGKVRGGTVAEHEDRPGYDKHDPLAEAMTTAIEQDILLVQRGLTTLLGHSRRLSKVDPTHGMRVHEAMKAARDALVQAAERTREMREHLDEDTP